MLLQIKGHFLDGCGTSIGGHFMNPASIMKIMGAKNRFTENHPKFVAFLRAVFGKGIEEGTVIEIRVTRPGEEMMMSNIRVQQSDLELLQELRELAK